MDLVPEEKETRRPHQAVIRFVEHPDQADHEDRHGSLGLEAVPFSARATVSYTHLTLPTKLEV